MSLDCQRIDTCSGTLYQNSEVGLSPVSAIQGPEVEREGGFEGAELAKYSVYMLLKVNCVLKKYLI